MYTCSKLDDNLDLSVSFFASQDGMDWLKISKCLESDHEFRISICRTSNFCQTLMKLCITSCVFFASYNAWCDARFPVNLNSEFVYVIQMSYVIICIWSRYSSIDEAFLVASFVLIPHVFTIILLDPFMMSQSRNWSMSREELSWRRQSTWVIRAATFCCPCSPTSFRPGNGYFSLAVYPDSYSFLTGGERIRNFFDIYLTIYCS